MSTGTNKERITENNGIISENNADLTALKTRINNLPTSGDTTATANDIALGKTAVSKGVKITGNIPTVEAEQTGVIVHGSATERNSVISAKTKMDIDYLYKKNSYVESDIPKTSVATAIGLTADKIKKDEVICGVTGTYEGSGTVSVPEKDVNFYDYDGTVVASYTASDFANLSALPANPTHTGLTSQGWNWNLTDAKSYVASYGKLNIGQMYVTDDGKTRIYIKLEEGRLEPYLGFAINGTATVDWGDNTTSTVTGTSTSTVVYTQHIYASAGNYVISISSGSNISFNGTDYYGSNILVKDTAASNNDKVYQNKILKIELGNNIVDLNNFSFKRCYSLSSITIPNTLVNIYRDCFAYCCSLSSITIPNTITSIGESAFSYCYSLSSITIPNSVTTLGDFVFINCYTLLNVTLPNVNFTTSVFSGCNSLLSVKTSKSNVGINANAFKNCYSLSNIKINATPTILSGAFQNCYGMAYYDFTTFTSIPSLFSTDAFVGIPSDCKIVVPDDLYENWIVASNWSTYASYIIKESDWV